MAWGDDDLPAGKARAATWGDDDLKADERRRDDERKARAQADARRRVSTTPGLVRATAQGASLGWADEIDAGMAALETGASNLLARARGKEPEYGMRDAYNAVMSADAEARDAYAQRNPVASATYNVLGGVAAPGSAGAASFIGRSNSLGSAMARSAVVGGGYGAAAGAGSAEPNAEARIKGAAAGAGAGAVIGGGTPLVARGARAVATRMHPADETAAMNDAVEALTEAGVDVRMVSRATFDQIRTQVRQGRNAREAALGILANTELPVPIPMTRGQRTGDPGQQLSENLMLRGARGSAASRHMRGFVGEQQDALRGNVDAIGEAVSGRPMERNVGGEAVSGRLNTLRDNANRGVNEAYDAARAAANDARLPNGESFVLSGRLREAVRPHATERTARGVFDEIDALGRGRNIAMQDIQAARTRLVALQQSSDGPTRNAAGTAKRALDAYMDEAVERGIIEGDEANLWRTAIGARRQYGRDYEAGDMIERLTTRRPDGSLAIDANSAANEILGATSGGMSAKKNLLTDISRIRGRLGADSQEWHGLRGEVFQRIANQGEGGVEFGQRQFSGVKFQKAWQDFNRNNPQLARALFTPEERAQLDRFATLAARVTSPVKGGDNSSNTAVTAARMLGNLRFLRGLPILKDLTNEIEVQANLSAARRATSTGYGRGCAWEAACVRGCGGEACAGIGWAGERYGPERLGRLSGLTHQGQQPAPHGLADESQGEHAGGE